ncbi:hypothetical protein B5E87_07825 [Massilimicrobiota sp. An142]|nr:hypothetical protein B5E87_07825 [Massilimicrobiota sp. An142]
MIGVMKMLTKEECKEAVSILKDQHEYLSFNLRANYPFSIEMIREVQDCFEQLIKEHFDTPPYRFDELKINMWVWDEKEKKCNKIIEIEGKNIDFYYITESIDKFIVEFEEGRFFPVTKSMEHQK